MYIGGVTQSIYLVHELSADFVQGLQNPTLSTVISFIWWTLADRSMGLTFNIVWTLHRITTDTSLNLLISWLLWSSQMHKSCNFKQEGTIYAREPYMCSLCSHLVCFGISGNGFVSWLRVQTEWTDFCFLFFTNQHGLLSHKFIYKKKNHGLFTEKLHL